MSERSLKLVNLTKHPIHIVDESEKTICNIDTSEIVARVVGSETETADKTLNDISIFKLYDGNKIIGLPEPQKDTIYIVSQIVLSKLDNSRKDVYAPLMNWSRKQRRKICTGLYFLSEKGENK